MCLGAPVTWEVCEGVFAAVGLSDSTSELLQDVVELRGALKRPVLCHTKALFQGMEFPLVCYQLIYKEKIKSQGGCISRSQHALNICPLMLLKRSRHIIWLVKQWQSSNACWTDVVMMTENKLLSITTFPLSQSPSLLATGWVYWSNLPSTARASSNQGSERTTSSISQAEFHKYHNTAAPHYDIMQCNTTKQQATAINCFFPHWKLVLRLRGEVVCCSILRKPALSPYSSGNSRWMGGTLQNRILWKGEGELWSVGLLSCCWVFFHFYILVIWNSADTCISLWHSSTYLISRSWQLNSLNPVWFKRAWYTFDGLQGEYKEHLMCVCVEYMVGWWVWGVSDLPLLVDFVPFGEPFTTTKPRFPLSPPSPSLSLTEPLSIPLC